MSGKERRRTGRRRTCHRRSRRHHTALLKLYSARLVHRRCTLQLPRKKQTHTLSTEEQESFARGLEASRPQGTVPARDMCADTVLGRFVSERETHLLALESPHLLPSDPSGHDKTPTPPAIPANASGTPAKRPASGGRMGGRNSLWPCEACSAAAPSVLCALACSDSLCLRLAQLCKLAPDALWVSPRVAHRTRACRSDVRPWGPSNKPFARIIADSPITRSGACNGTEQQRRPPALA